MKKFILLLAAASLSQAAVLQSLCSPTNQNVITNGVNVSPIAVTCGPLSADAGFALSSIGLELIGSFQDTIPGGGSKSIHFSLTNSLNAATIAGDATGTFSANTGDIVGLQVAIVQVGSIASLTVTGTATNNGINALPDNASFTALVNATQVSTTGTPEPVSMLLFGSGLIGLSVIGRKKFARK